MKFTTFGLSMAVSTLAAGSVWSADTELTILDWAGYEDPEFISAYIEKHNDAPSYSFFGNEEEAFQKLRSGFDADLGHPCAPSVKKWYLAGLLDPIDTSRLKNWDHVSPVKESFKYDGEYYFVPIDWAATGVLFRTDEVSEDEVSSLKVFTNPKFAGRISLPDNVDDVYSLAFLANGISDWTDATEEDVAAASAWLRKVHPNVRTYWADSAELGQLMSTGEVIVSWSWNEAFVNLSAEEKPVAFQREATEGSSAWYCGYVDLKNGTGNDDKAYDFLNAWLEPGTAEYIVTAWGFGHANLDAMRAIGSETLDAVGLGKISAPVLDQRPIDIRLREKMISEFEQIKAGF